MDATEGWIFVVLCVQDDLVIPVVFLLAQTNLEVFDILDGCFREVCHGLPIFVDELEIRAYECIRLRSIPEQVVNAFERGSFFLAPLCRAVTHDIFVKRV